MRPLTYELTDKHSFRMALQEIMDASHEDIVEGVFDQLLVENVTVTRTFDCDTATLDDVRNFIGTIIQDIQQRSN